jgi:hypothetical protein
MLFTIFNKIVNYRKQLLNESEEIFLKTEISDPVPGYLNIA